MTCTPALHTHTQSAPHPATSSGEELWRLADLTELNGLKAFLKATLDAACAAPAAEFAMSLDDRNLLEACYKIAAEHLPHMEASSLRCVRVSVARGLMASYGCTEQAWEFVERWAQANPDASEEELLQMTMGVDVSRLQCTFVMNRVVASGLMPDEEARRAIASVPAHPPTRTTLTSD